MKRLIGVAIIVIVMLKGVEGDAVIATPRPPKPVTAFIPRTPPVLGPLSTTLSQEDQIILEIKREQQEAQWAYHCKVWWWADKHIQNLTNLVLNMDWTQLLSFFKKIYFSSLHTQDVNLNIWTILQPRQVLGFIRFWKICINITDLLSYTVLFP